MSLRNQGAFNSKMQATRGNHCIRPQYMDGLTLKPLHIFFQNVISFSIIIALKL